MQLKRNLFASAFHINLPVAFLSSSKTKTATRFLAHILAAETLQPFTFSLTLFHFPLSHTLFISLSSKQNLVLSDLGGAEAKTNY